ncbi:hypothetical protein [Exiguobacterium sp. S3]|uniref:hypothetical protein n=1 Tax=Exiguobacterium sp. S3 TaxID=483245 RepID=UPI001BE90EA8|nr:hypothetical protein [Exiguobacterium sp. S3]
MKYVKRNWLMLLIIVFILGVLIFLAVRPETEIKKEKSNTVSSLESQKHIDIKKYQYVTLLSSTMPSNISTTKEWEDTLKIRKNFLFFFNSDGDWDMFSTNLLEFATVKWTGDGVYVSDYKYDYFIDNNGDVHKKENINLKRNVRDGTISQSYKFESSDDTVWTAMDIGFVDEGYHTQISKQHKDSVSKFIVQGAYGHFFNVENNIYATTVVMDLKNDLNDEAHVKLVRFEEQGKELIPKVIGTQPFDYDRVLYNTFSMNDKTYSIGETWDFEDASKRDLSLFTWDMDKGTSTSTVLISNIQEKTNFENSTSDYDISIDEVEPNQLLIKTPWGELYDVDVDKKKVMNTINLDLPFDSMSAMTLDMHNDQKVLTLSGNEKNDYPLSITETKASSPKNHAQVTLKNQEVLLNYSKKYKINELTLESIEKRKE